MLISVIIPTCRRAHLCRRAVESVRAQTYPAHEILVVIDGVDDGTRAVIEALQDSRTRVVETGVNRGPAATRNFGVGLATGDYVAMLDDDDEWTTDKLEQQMGFIVSHRLEGEEFVVSCRTMTKWHGTNRLQVLPATTYTPGCDLSEYLLDRGHPFRQTGLIASGTLLFPRSLALRVPFPNDDVHEDWSWLLLCVVRHHVPLLMCEKAMLVYNLNHELSRNQVIDWHKSLDWGRRYRGLISARAFAGLVSSTTAWRAKRQAGMHALQELAHAMGGEGQPTMMHWLTLVAVMLLPQAITERIRRRSYSSSITHITPKLRRKTLTSHRPFSLDESDHV
jgi:glycosyltransferase involved in cell wall biosynthesis